MKTLDTQSEHIAHILKLLAHPKRLLILCKLRNWPQTVGELEKWCTISQSQLSQFLIKMRDEWILSSEKSGQFVTYNISDPRILELANSLQRIFCTD